MQAIILAAGCGSRLGQFNNGGPKALIKMEKIHLIDYQLSVLRYFGITDVCVVVGYQADMLQSVLGDRCYCICNNRYADTNSLYSLWLARKWVSDDLLLINSDVLAHPDIFWRLLTNPGNSLVYDSTSSVEEESMKVALEGDKLLHISKSLGVDESKGESLGILKFQASATKVLFREAEKAISTGGVNQWAPAAVQGFVHKLPMTCIDMAGLPWVEIDYVEDLLNASKMVWPEIRKSITSPPYTHAFALPASSSVKTDSGD
ncbi:MAG: phosphocholine cytidylyltransferase family protein [Deltaproteobacteria bacterium]|jgi:choline kinase|nr:phosphocholine cytidylyltransferase family protein [Deltaproteobacteria bacterium]